MFVFIPGSIPPVKFGPGGTDPPDGSISPVTYICNGKEGQLKEGIRKENESYKQ